MTRATFDLIKEKYGFYSSWAIWADAGGKPKSNIGDLRVFDMDANPSVLGELKPHIVFVGLNAIKGVRHKLLTFIRVKHVFESNKRKNLPRILTHWVSRSCRKGVGPTY